MRRGRAPAAASWAPPADRPRPTVLPTRATRSGSLLEIISCTKIRSGVTTKEQNENVIGEITGSEYKTKTGILSMSSNDAV